MAAFLLSIFAWIISVLGASGQGARKEAAAPPAARVPARAAKLIAQVATRSPVPLNALNIQLDESRIQRLTCDALVAHDAQLSAASFIQTAHPPTARWRAVRLAFPPPRS